MTVPWAALAGARVITAAVAGTAVFALTATIAAIAGHDATLWPAFVVSLALFTIGAVVFVAALAAAAERSRRDEIGIGGLFFLAGKDTAPLAVKRWLLGALGAQVVVAFATAAARPFSTLAFGMLVPLYGVALCGLWTARHGRFGPRIERPGRRPPVMRDADERGAEPDAVEVDPGRGKNAAHE